jgi:hypothetical protein
LLDIVYQDVIIVYLIGASVPVNISEPELKEIIILEIPSLLAFPRSCFSNRDFVVQVPEIPYKLA